MTDVSLIPQNRISDLSSSLSAKANDSDVVKLTGNQTVGGTKTFNIAPLISTTDNDGRIVSKLNNTTIGVTPSSNQFAGFTTQDSQGTYFASANCSYNTNGRIGCNFWVSRSDSGSNVQSSMGVYIDDGGTNAYTIAPTPTEDTTSSTQIDTVGARNTKLQKGITNCITEIPQDINLELNDGTLTLKAGSKIYKLDGTSITINSDVSLSTSAYGFNQQCLIYYSPFNNSLETPNIYICFSGSGYPTITVYQYMLYFDTTAETYYWTSDYGENWTERTSNSYPIAIATVGDSNWTSIDQVFNGFGYIGSTIFALPNVKGLIPNGRNADGTLKNTETITNNVLTYTNPDTSTGNYYIQFRGNFISRAYANPSSWRYDEERNIILWNNTVKQEVLFAGNLVLSSGRVESLTPKTPFHAVDYNDLSMVHFVVETYKNGTSWYRIWSDGWCEQGDYKVGVSAANTMEKVSLLKSYASTEYLVQATNAGSNTTAYTVKVGSNSKNDTDGFYISLSNASAAAWWTACGYIR